MRRARRDRRRRHRLRAIVLGDGRRHRHQAADRGARPHERLRHGDAPQVRAARRDPGGRQPRGGRVRRSLEYIREFVPEVRKAPLAGNTIGTDRMFLAEYMPRLDGHAALSQRRRVQHQGARQALVPAGLLHAPRQDGRPPRPRRHPRVDPRSSATTARPSSSPRRAGPRRARGDRRTPSGLADLRAAGYWLVRRRAARLRWRSPFRGNAVWHGGYSSVGRALVVVQKVAGSSPVTHPTRTLSSPPPGPGHSASSRSDRMGPWPPT